MDSVAPPCLDADQVWISSISHSRAPARQGALGRYLRCWRKALQPRFAAQTWRRPRSARPGSHCFSTPAARITRAQRSLSFCRNAANSTREVPTVLAPSSLSRCWVCGLASAARTASLSYWTMRSGVPAGANIPTQGAVSWKPRNPASAMVGTVGKSRWRYSAPTASTFGRCCETFAAMPSIG